MIVPSPSGIVVSSGGRTPSILAWEMVIERSQLGSCSSSSWMMESLGLSWEVYGFVS